MSSFIIAAFAIFFTVLTGLGLSLRLARRRVDAKLISLEVALETETKAE